MGSTIAGEIGVFGYKPSVLMDMLAGKRAEVGTKVGAYMRTFSGDCSPSDLETALQVLYIFYGLLLFWKMLEILILLCLSEGPEWNELISIDCLICFIFQTVCSLFINFSKQMSCQEKKSK